MRMVKLIIVPCALVLSLIFHPVAYAGGWSKFLMSEVTHMDKKMTPEARSLNYDKRLLKLSVVGTVVYATWRIVIAPKIDKVVTERLEGRVKKWDQIKKDANTPIWKYKSESMVGKPRPKGHIDDPTLRF